jgi:isoleucyl-tRNA synthetase
VDRWEVIAGRPFIPDSTLSKASTNDVDVWILAASFGLVDYVHQEMKAYRLYTVVPRLVEFIDELTKWFVCHDHDHDNNYYNDDDDDDDGDIFDIYVCDDDKIVVIEYIYLLTESFHISFITIYAYACISFYRYIRLNRTRIKGEYGQEDALVGLNVLYEVLTTMCQIMAPFTPFFTEYIYQYIRKLHPSYQKTDDTTIAIDSFGRADSVHYLMLPLPGTV